MLGLKRRQMRRVLFSIMLPIYLILVCVYTFAQSIPSVITTLDWKPDGSQIAVGYDNGIVELIDPTRQILKTFTFGDVTVFKVAWRPPDGQELAVLTNSSLNIIDTKTETIRTIEISEIEVISWSPDGTRLASDGAGDSNPVYIIDTTTFDIVQTLLGNFRDGVGPVAWHPIDNDLVAAGTFLGNLNVWNVSTGEVVHKWRDLVGDSVTELVWSPDGSKLAAGHGGGSIHIWNVADWQLLTSGGQVGVGTDMAWNPKGTQIVSVGGSSIWITDIATGETAIYIRLEEFPRVVVWSPDGSQLAYRGVDGAVEIVPAPSEG